MRLLFYFAFTLHCLIASAQTPAIAPLPAGANDGINITGPQSVTLVFHAPDKPYVYLRGDHNSWQQNNAALMNVTPDGEYHWKSLTGLNSTQTYRYQFVVGPNNLECADPYAELILDPWNDQWISTSVYPNMPAFPAQANWPVSVFQIQSPAFNWTDGGFQRPARNRLCIYELLVRDFSTEKSFQEVINKLDYLQDLGINAIELLPVNEFDGNDSWGYNPNFWFAPDKYYGPANKLRELVNEAHSRGIAVILDMVFNHSWGLNPQVRMYNEDGLGFGLVTADNPWLNTYPTHDYNVGTDYNHESTATRDWVKRVMDHWRESYHIDGYRLDLSKGLTQNNTLGDIAAWGAYDQSRVDILMDYANHVWGQDPNFYMILEHLADNPEEVVLADAGFLMWGPMNYSYAEAAMGYSSDLSWASYQQRGFAYANLIAYMESHDEERLMFKCKNYGNGSGAYQIQNEDVALDRMELCNAFYLTLPGPKMMWQFGELGYDLSINDCGNGTIDPGCRTANKPVLWEYFDDPDRRDLYDVVSALNHLRNNYEVTHTWNYDHSLNNYQKRIRLFGADMDLIVIGNFDVVGGSISPQFTHTGTWYEYFSQQSIEVTDTQAGYTLAPGEYRLYTDVFIALPGTSDPGLAGCTDSNAANYSPAAQSDDGSCVYSHTFTVQTVGISVDPAGIHIAGSFQGWSPSSTPMTETSQDVWQYTVDLPSGINIEYKYINGTAWGQDEGVPAECGVPNGLGGFNRLLTSISQSYSAPPHCFAGCDPCIAAPGLVNVTFRVDMNSLPVDPLGIHLAGNFQSWDPGSTPMAVLDASLWSITLAFEPGTSLEYKFINGAVWGQDESVPAACASGLNRTYTVGTTDEILPIVCFGECQSCTGCNDPTALNYAPYSDGNGTCEYGTCEGDLNYDGMRNVGDLLLLLTETGCLSACGFDLNGDSSVNSLDLIIFLALFGQDCP